MNPTALRYLYVVNLALMATHQADAAYWREWNLLDLVGGHGAFLVVSLAVFVFFIHGFRELVVGHRSGLWYAAVLAGGGLTTATCHAFFLAGSGSAFTAPVSLVILAAIAVLSAVQLWVVIQAVLARREGAKVPDPDFVD